MRERFAKFGLELHPEKTRIIHLDREQRCRTNRKDHQSYTFDFLGFTHYWGKSRKGNPTLRRKTSAKKFRKACKGMNEEYLEYYSLSEPRIVHYLYTLSFVSLALLKSCVLEICMHSSVRDVDVLSHGRIL